MGKGGLLPLSTDTDAVSATKNSPSGSLKSEGRAETKVKKPGLALVTGRTTPGGLPNKYQSGEG